MNYMPAVLEIEGLCVGYGTSAEPVLRNLALQIGPGESLGVFGDSGSGKSTLIRAIPRLLPQSASIRGAVRFAGHNLLDQDPRELRQVRGRQIGMIPQEPSEALNPIRKAGRQLEEVLHLNRPIPAQQARLDSLSLLRRFFAGDAERIAQSYPHQLSGGERQRVVIAQAIARGPALLLADESTSALDSVAQKAFLDLLLQLRRESGISLLLVSHNRAALHYATDRCLELRDGRLHP